MSWPTGQAKFSTTSKSDLSTTRVTTSLWVERGELLVRGYNLMDGYYGEPDATAAIIDEQGWLHTGDIAYMNDDRYIKICDRKKDLFVVGGFNVAPAEVEGILMEWDAISACGSSGYRTSGGAK